MPRSRLALLVASTLVAAGAMAAGFGLKPGLWEVKVVKQVVDGTDHSAQVATATSQMQQAMAGLPADQRSRVEAMMRQHGVAASGDGTVKICVSAKMASRDKPIVDRSGRCEPASVTHAGNQTLYEFSCTEHGVTTKGKGVATSSDGLITTHVDMTTTEANGTSHVLQSDSEMKFVGADCGDLKPADAGG